MNSRKSLPTVLYKWSLVLVMITTLGLASAALAGGATTTWQVLNSGERSLDVLFQLPQLGIKNADRNGQIWQTMEIDGAALVGNPGEPGLPLISRLVALPAGMTLRAEVLSATSSLRKNLHLLPIQDGQGEDFSFCSASYAQESPQPGTPKVQVGKPGILAGQPVVTLSVQPVVYNAPAQQATIWDNIRLKLEYVPDPQAPAPNRSVPRKLPLSFVKQMQKEVLGFQPVTDAANKTQSLPRNEFGTYVAVHSGQGGVQSGIAPLLQWRREQGYHVIELNTSLGGGSNENIKSTLLDIYNDPTIPPLEFITIFGDVSGTYGVPAWTENLSGYYGGGDHYYTTLDGDDILADAHIGRVSFNTAAEMTTVINKILGYEKNPPMDDTSWYGRACLQGDPSASGITTIYVNQWLKGQLQALGWSQVDTTWSGNFVNPMMAQVGQGVTAYGYRGYLGTSGIGNGHVMSLTNGGRLAMALLPTCGSGSFASATASRSEAWLRSPNGGAVAAIGTATTGTHTRYNNCYYVGTWDGLLNSGDFRIGVAHTLGKIALYNGYDLAEPEHAEIWAVWNNVMGDGATEMWTGVPQTLDVAYPAQISVGAQALPVQVHSGGLPVAGARVCLFRAGAIQNEDFQISGITDNSGRVLLNLPDLGTGSMNLTVTGHDYLPHLGGLTAGPVDVFCGVTSRLLNDGNDGQISPGETLELTPLLTNHGTTDAFNVSAEITVLDGPAAIGNGSLDYGTIAAGAEIGSTSPALLNITNDAADGSPLRLLITATDGNEIWTSLLEETIRSAAFSVSELNLDDFGGSVDPGESGRLDITLANVGGLDATAVSATLSSDNPWVVLTDAEATFGNITAGSSARDLLSPFRISVSSDGFGGQLALFNLTVTYSNGLQATANFATTIGTATANQPSGPDNYGYYAIDNSDTISPLVPTYDWVGIDPDHGAQGQDLGLSDFGWEQDDTKTVDLPFSFGFYGVTYDRISICSNGWLAMGETPLVFYRNFPLPAPHSPGALIAPFWDNLSQESNHKVYTWYDDSEHRFIIQWYQMPNQFANSPQNFEVILLDPTYHPTATGDGLILFQYDQVQNSDSRDGYATVGIQNQNRTIGLNYSYWNQYAPGAAPLTMGRAILFAPLGEVALPAANITPTALAETVLPGQQVTDYLHLSNTGDEGSNLEFSLTKIDPATLAGEKSLPVQEDPLVQPRSLDGSQVSSSTSEYETDTTVDLPVHVICNSPDDEWLLKIELDLPTGLTVNSATGMGTPHGEMTWNGETGSAVTTTWGSGSTGVSGFLANGEAGDFTVNLTFDPDLVGDVVIGWQVSGDSFGAPPHLITGEMVLTALSPSIQITQPDAETTAVIGSNLPISFVAANGPELVNIALQREADGPWQSLAFAWPADSSPWIWNVSGEPGPYARIRVSDAADGTVFGLSDVFVVGRNLDWLQPEVISGQVAAGQTLDLAITMDGQDLVPDIYQADLRITHNGGDPLLVPVTLTVTNASGAGNLPGAVTLLGNHPNPFNPQTTISFYLPDNRDVRLRVYSARGRLVRSLLDGLQPAGRHHAVWDGRDSQGHAVASGVYFYRLEAGTENFTSKMVLTK